MTSFPADGEPHPDPGDGPHRGQRRLSSHKEMWSEFHVSVLRRLRLSFHT